MPEDDGEPFARGKVFDGPRNGARLIRRRYRRLGARVPEGHAGRVDVERADRRRACVAPGPLRIRTRERFGGRGVREVRLPQADCDAARNGIEVLLGVRSERAGVIVHTSI